MQTFYGSSLVCIVLRIVLFLDPIANYCLQIYFDLVSLPTFLFILTGFALFLMILESVLNYRYIEIDEKIDWTMQEKEDKIKCLKKSMNIVHWIPPVCLFFTILFFGVSQGVCITKQDCSDEYIAMPGIVTAQFVNMILLIIVTYLFLTKINERYGNTYKKAKWTVGLYLIIFTLSFTIRGVFDLLLVYDVGETAFRSATFLAFFYMFTELIPLFTLFSVHIHTFRPIAKQL
jgi:hypothetical protein